MCKIRMLKVKRIREAAQRCKELNAKKCEWRRISIT